jgi:hypothetical protein
MPKTNQPPNNTKINSFKQLLIKRYCFSTNPFTPNWKTAQQFILQTPSEFYLVQPHNKAVFNRANTNNGLPRGTYSLLRLGLKFCMKSGNPKNKSNTSIERFEHNIRTKYLMQNEMNTDFISELYIQSQHWDSSKASKEVELAPVRFQECLSKDRIQHKIKT